ncbi:MAG: hypothetical protein ACLT98_16935 [Eggerthellaceae bacterium]
METSTLEVQLADDAAVERFCRVGRDFGSSCKESEAQGANARRHRRVGEQARSRG